MELLAELLQGNTSYGNSSLLLQTKLVGILERLVDKKSLDGGDDVALAELRVGVLVLLHALLEGSTNDNLRVMLRTIDLGDLAKATAKSVEAAAALPEGDERKGLATDAAYSLYSFLLHLKGFNEQHFQEKHHRLLPGQSPSARVELATLNAPFGFDPFALPWQSPLFRGCPTRQSRSSTRRWLPSRSSTPPVRWSACTSVTPISACSSRATQRTSYCGESTGRVPTADRTPDLH